MQPNPAARDAFWVMVHAYAVHSHAWAYPGTGMHLHRIRAPEASLAKSEQPLGLR